MPSEQMLRDLQASGLTPEDLDARPLENLERAALRISQGIHGFIIPYRSIENRLLPFYRVKCFDSLPKYKQAPSTGNHVYFPRAFKEAAELAGYFIITEGEKKAACAIKNGFPCVGLGGVDSWRNRTLILPEGATLNQPSTSNQTIVKLAAGAEEAGQDLESNLAVGLQDLIDFAVQRNLTAIICFDSGPEEKGVGFDEQRAAATLGFELRFRGIPLRQIRQLIIPGEGFKEKVGLDDYIVEKGRGEFAELVRGVLERRLAFPRHPNIRDFINRKLQKSKLSRKEAQQVALSVLCELDSTGMRLRSEADDQMYYFAGATKKLMSANLRRTSNDVLTDSEFSRFLYSEYGISHADFKLTGWLATQFTSEQPIDSVSPSRVIAIRGDDVCYQINDGQFIRISGTGKFPFRICDNGTEQILFESGKTKPLESGELHKAVWLQYKQEIKPWWFEVLRDVRLKRQERTLQLIGLLFYISPWLNRWRGTQLPVEMIIGEPGSGKSSLYELRLKILIGSPDLRNAPQDLKDWYAGVANAGGLYVTDNVQMTDKSLRQQISDEMCRMVTEPHPHIEMRKYYTNADLIRIPVQTMFAMTAVMQPFHNVDLVQRSVIIELDKGEEAIEYAMNWSESKLTKFGGRTEWVAHHLVVLQKFLAKVATDWDPHYKAKHRLVNLEQALVLMAKTLGIEHDWIVPHLTASTNTAVSESDWAFEGICEYIRQMKVGLNGSSTQPQFTASDISGWAVSEEEYSSCIQLTNSRSLGRYIQSHKQMLATVAGMKELGTRANRIFYTFKGK